MFRIKLIVTVSCAMLVLGAWISGTAFAGGEWDVNGVPLVGTVAIAGIALSPVNSRLKVHAVPRYSIECAGHEVLINGGVLIAPDGILAKGVTFPECKIIEAESCTLTSNHITTVALHGLAHLDNNERLSTIILVLPDTKTTLATINFEGENCAFKGVQPATGGIHLLIDDGYLPKEVHLVLGLTLKGQLKIGPSEALIEALDLEVKLTKGQTWRFL